MSISDICRLDLCNEWLESCEEESPIPCLASPPIHCSHRECVVISTCTFNIKGVDEVSIPA